MPLLSWLNKAHLPEEREEDVPPETDDKQEAAYVTKEEHDRTTAILQGLQETMQTMAQGFNALTADRQTHQRQPEPAIEDVSDEEIEEALQSGRGAEKFRKMVNAGIERVKREVIAPAMGDGYTAIAGLTKEVVAAQMPYYKKYQKEIDQYLDALAPNAKLNPTSYKAAHDYVVGQHVTELLAEQAEQTARQKNEPPRTGDGGFQTTRGQRQGEQPTRTFNFSEDNQAALSVKGDTPDTLAKKMGYKDWGDYMQRCQDAEDNT